MKNLIASVFCWRYLEKTWIAVHVKSSENRIEYVNNQLLVICPISTLSWKIHIWFIQLLLVWIPALEAQITLIKDKNLFANKSVKHNEVFQGWSKSTTKRKNKIMALSRRMEEEQKNKDENPKRRRIERSKWNKQNKKHQQYNRMD